MSVGKFTQKKKTIKNVVFLQKYEFAMTFAEANHVAKQDHISEKHKCKLFCQKFAIFRIFCRNSCKYFSFG